MIDVFFVALLLLFLAGIFFLLSKKITIKVSKTKMEHGIQDGKITYTDLDIPAEPLFSRRLGIVGKPDYIVETGNQLIPVEVKTGNPNLPYKNHVLQLAAYCQILEDVYGKQVPYGVLVYDNGVQYRIPFDDNLRFELNYTIQKMRIAIETGMITRNHKEPQRCIYCSMKEYCKSRLATSHSSMKLITSCVFKITNQKRFH